MVTIYTYKKSTGLQSAFVAHRPRVLISVHGTCRVIRKYFEQCPRVKNFFICKASQILKRTIIGRSFTYLRLTIKTLCVNLDIKRTVSRLRLILVFHQLSLPNSHYDTKC